MIVTRPREVVDLNLNLPAEAGNIHLGRFSQRAAAGGHSLRHLIKIKPLLSVCYVYHVGV